MSFRVDPLADHDVSGFRCGNAELDDWLIGHASNARGQGTRTYVLTARDRVVVGYFAIAPHLVTRDEVPAKVGRGAPRHIPAILLAKLALAESLHGQGLGAELLLIAIETIIDAARRVGGRIIVVDAIDDTAKRFYERHNFTPVPGNDHRLVLKLSTAAKALGVDWP